MNILAMDLGKSNTVVCFYDSDSAKHKFGKVKTAPQQIHDLIAEHSPDRIVFEMGSATGIGPRLAEAVVAFLDEPNRFKNGKQVGSYVGLTPRQYQSGEMNHQGKISGQDNKLLRALLVEVSWLGLRHNPWMLKTYERILRGSASRKKIAITAVARKLLVRCWAMMRDEQDWRDEKAEQVA